MAQLPLGTLLLLSLAVHASASADPQLPGMPPPVPGPARVVLTVDKPTFFLGENVLVHYCVENTGTTPMVISLGGDYRGGSRSARFKMTVVDSRGTSVADPDPAGVNLGGLGTRPAVAPGQRLCQSLPLARYARIDAPGVYDVRITHDLGWPDRSAPTGSLRVTFVRPTAAEAESVIAAMEALPAFEGSTIGRLSRPYPDFTALRYDVYLPSLVQRAQGGLRPAVQGLGAIPTPDATRALIALTHHRDRALALEASRQLAMRVPDPALTGNLESRGPFVNQLQEPRRYLIVASWRDEFAPAVRASARMWLASEDVQEIVQGAFMLEAVGTPADGQPLSSALSRAIERTLTLPFEAGVYPRPRGALAELRRAAKVLVARGYVAVWGESTGDIALWLVALGNGARPDGWQPLLARALARPNAYVRELAFDHAPAQSGQELAPMIRRGLSSPNRDEQIAAGRLLNRAGFTDLSDALLVSLRTSTDSLLMRETWNTLNDFGLRIERTTVLAERLNDVSAAANALDLLFGLFDRGSLSYSPELSAADLTGLRGAWLAFIAQNRTDIEAGRRLPLNDDTPVALVPPTWWFERPDRTRWPRNRSPANLVTTIPEVTAVPDRNPR